MRMTNDPMGAPPGTLDMMILSLLVEEPLHGYLLARRIEERSGGVLGIEEGSLYPALQRLRKRKVVSDEWLTQESGRKIRVYSITRAGRKELVQTAGQWRTVNAAVEKIIQSIKGERSVRLT